MRDAIFIGHPNMLYTQYYTLDHWRVKALQLPLWGWINIKEFGHPVS